MKTDELLPAFIGNVRILDAIQFLTQLESSDRVAKGE
jgi:hypothetical protein